MRLNGYSIENLWGFRQHFSVEDLIEAINNRFVLAKWFSHILDSGNLGDDEISEIKLIRRYFERLIYEDRKIESWSYLYKISQANSSLAKMLNNQEKRVKKEKISEYRNFCALLLYFLKLARYVISPHSDDEEVVHLYISREFFGCSAALELRKTAVGEAMLFCDGCAVCEMTFDPKLIADTDPVYVAFHPDTGCIGIDREGSIINRSAFDIPDLEQKAVKVAISQCGFAILTESGSIVHNLRFSLLPKIPVKNVDLIGEQVLFLQMD